MEQLFWLILGFVLAIVWEKYKEWNKFKYGLMMLYEELGNSILSIERKYGELSGELRNAVSVAQEGGISEIGMEDLSGEPVFELMMPKKSSAWETFLANGYLNKLDREDANVVKDAYDTLIGSDFIKGLVPSLISASMSPAFSVQTQNYMLKTSRIAPLYPVVFALPKLKKASEKLEILIKKDMFKSFWCFLTH